MTANWPKNGYGTAVASIAAGATDSTAGTPIEVGDQDEIVAQLKMTGHNAGSAGNVSFYFVTSLNGTDYSTPGTPLVAALTGTTAVISEPFIISLKKKVKLLKFVKIINGDGAQQVDSLQVIIMGKEPGDR